MEAAVGKEADAALEALDEADPKTVEAAILIGCPDEASANMIAGSVVGIVDGFFIVTAPEAEGS